MVHTMLSKLHHFALKDCTLPSMVSKTAALLKVLSLNVDPACKKRIPIKFIVFTIVTWSCYFYVYVFSMVWFVFCKSLDTGDVISAMIVFALGIASEISTVKWIYMLLYQDSFRSMIERYLIHDSKFTSNTRFAKNQLTVMKRVNRRTVIFWIMIIGNGVLYATKPLLLPGRHLMEDIEFIYGLVPHMVSPNYEIAYFLTLGGVIFTCYGTANISGFFIIIIGYIEAQMFSISEELVNIWDDALDYYNKNYAITEICFSTESKEVVREKHIILNQYVKKQLHAIIDTHTTNIGFLSQIDSVFRGAIAIEFGLLIISLIAEFLGGLENTYLLLPFALNQVIMDCITGQKLLDASIMFQRAVFESKWENFDVNNMKTVLMMMQSSQKDMTISAGGLEKLNYLCLMSVGRMIYSTYTALRSTINH